MTRLVAADFEGGTISPLVAAGTAGSVIAGAAIDGSLGWRTAINAASLLSAGSTQFTSPGAGHWVYARIRYRHPGNPTSALTLLQLRIAAAQVAGIRLNTGGTLQLQGGASTNLGSASAALVTGQVYTVELGMKVNVGAVDDFEARLDGVAFATGTLAATDSGVDQVRLGWVTTPGAASGIQGDFDSIALNDDTGAAPDNTWPGVPGGFVTTHSFFHATG